MVTPKAIKPSKKPSTLLGFLLFGLLALFVVFCCWQAQLPTVIPGTVDTSKAYRLELPQWVVAFSAVTAMSGWIIAAMVTIRNSIKQYTITTLLQSRLSTVYMQNADKVSGHYSEYDARRKADPTLAETPTDKVDVLALRYILNYFEFCAIGVKRGDLDEDMLRDSLRGILKKNIAMSRLWIDAQRIGSPSLYEHVGWLHQRWLPNEVQLNGW